MPVSDINFREELLIHLSQCSDPKETIQLICSENERKIVYHESKGHRLRLTLDFVVSGHGLPLHWSIRSRCFFQYQHLLFHFHLSFYKQLLTAQLNSNIKEMMSM